MSYPPAPPLLLTRRLSSFLHASLESLQHQSGQQPSGSTIETALLVTPSGKLLAYESPLPVRTLRTHSSVAASLWAIHASSSPSVAVALGQAAPINRPSAVQPLQAPQAQQLSSPPLLPTHYGPPGDSTGFSPASAGQVPEEEPYHDGSAPVSIAASFNGGAVFVVQRLRCGLLFACSTPVPANRGSRPSTAINSPTDVMIVPTAPGTSGAPSSLTHPAPEAIQSTLPPLPHPPPDAAAVTAIPAVLRPSTASPSTTSAPTPIVAPSRPSADLAASVIPAASVCTTATVDTYETARTGHLREDREGAEGDRGQGNGRDGETEYRHAKTDVTDHDVNADAASTTTVGTSTTAGGGHRAGSVAATLAIARRQVEELAHLLDEKLGSLVVPEESIGINGFC